MRHRSVLFVVVAAGITVLLPTILLRHRPKETQHEASPHATPLLTADASLQSRGALNQGVLPTAQQWARLSDEERLQWLEKMGQVPDYAEMPRDWVLAERTTWWGKPLNPGQFWKGRVVWEDGSAVSSARRHGRAFPPPPYKDPHLPTYSGESEAHVQAPTVEGPNIAFRWNSTEAAFWTRFSEEHPRPPESLEAEQLQVATMILGQRYDFEQRTNPAKLSPEALMKAESARKSHALEAKYPSEMLTDEALFWCYVLDQRHRYSALLQRGYAPGNPALTVLANGLFVDPVLVTEPLTEAQVKAAQAWKIAYLRRLRREKADESYINAYLQTWNLSANQVFQETNR